MNKVVTVIPSRLASSRLPNKPLLDINGRSLIHIVCDNVREYCDGDIIVASGDKEICDACDSFGVRSVLTDPKLPSGTDRIAQALNIIDKDGSLYDIVVNFQGDNSNVNPIICNQLVELLEKSGADIATCAMIIKDEQLKNDPNVVKVVMGLRDGETEGRALYFTRATAPFTREPEDCANQDLYHHIGIYVFRADALKRFVSLPVGVLEDREKLEQLRALENGMNIVCKVVDGIKLIDDAPADVNTLEELELSRKFF